MRQLLFVLFSVFLMCSAFGQVRPKCLVCKDVEWTDVSTLVHHSKTEEIKVETVLDTVEYVAKPRHQACAINPVTGAVCTVEVAEVKAASVAVLKKITTVQYVAIVSIEPALGIRFEAEITNDCN